MLLVYPHLWHRHKLLKYSYQNADSLQKSMLALQGPLDMYALSPSHLLIIDQPCLPAERLKDGSGQSRPAWLGLYCPALRPQESTATAAVQGLPEYTATGLPPGRG